MKLTLWMNDYIKGLSELTLPFKQFVNYYNKNYNKELALSVFLTLSFEQQIGTILVFLENIHNIGIQLDSCNYVLYFIDLEDSRARNMLAQGKLPWIHTSKQDKSYNVTNIYYLAIDTAFEYIVKPF